MLLCSEHPVEIFSTETGSVVPKNDSIRVDHRDDLEDNVLSYLPCFFRKDILEKALNHIASIGLSWVDSSDTNQTSFILILDGVVSDSQERYLYAGKRGTKFLLRYYCFYITRRHTKAVIVFFEVKNDIFKMAESIGWAIGKGDFIILKLKVVLKGKTQVVGIMIDSHYLAIYLFLLIFL